MIVEWFIAMLSSVTLVVVLLRLIQLGLLNTAGPKWLLWGTLVAIWIGTLLLKLIEIELAEGGATQLLRYTLCRKADDISFWMMLAGVGVGFVALETCANSSLKKDRAVIATWLVLAACSIAAYLFIVGVYNRPNAGTFFWRAQRENPTAGFTILTATGPRSIGAGVLILHPQPEVKKLLQVIEGCCVIWFLATVHLVHAIYLCSLWRAKCEDLTRVAAFKLSGLYAFVIFALGAPLALMKLVLPGLCTPVLSSFGNKTAYTSTNVLAYGAAVGWPFLLPIGAIVVRRIRCSMKANPAEEKETSAP